MELGIIDLPIAPVLNRILLNPLPPTPEDRRLHGVHLPAIRQPRDPPQDALLDRRVHAVDGIVCDPDRDTRLHRLRLKPNVLELVKATLKARRALRKHKPQDFDRTGAWP